MGTRETGPNRGASSLSGYSSETPHARVSYYGHTMAFSVTADV